MPNNINYISPEISEVLHKLAYMSFNNVKWSCLYSGIGILHVLSDKDLKRLTYKYDDKENIKEQLKGMVFLKCLYKKGKPVFSTPPEEIINPGKYMWDFSSFNKTITPSSQSFGILSLLKSAEVNYKSDKPLSRIMVGAAEIYYDFLTTYLRNETGLFVSVENKTKYINDELKIKTNQKEAKLLDQIFVHEAFLYLYNLTSNNNLKEFYNPKSLRYLDEAKNLFEFIFENYNLLLEQSTKEICYTISSLSRCCRISKDTESIINYQHIIALLCAELESRVKINGEIESSSGDSVPASIITHFRAASALLDGYIETSIEKFKDLSRTMYLYLSDLYDSSLGLYLQGSYNKIKYSIRDIADIVYSLITYYKISKDEDILRNICEFYESSIENSGILQSVLEREVNFAQNNIFLSEKLPSFEEIIKPPVFLKSFRINFKKTINLNVSKHFNSFYSLYASYIFLNQLKPEIENNDLFDSSNENPILTEDNVDIPQEIADETININI